MNFKVGKKYINRGLQWRAYGKKDICRVFQLTAVFIEMIYVMYVEKGQKTMTILFGNLIFLK